MLNRSVIKFYVDIRENPSARLEIGIIETFHKEEPDFSHEPQWNEPGTSEWGGQPNHKEANQSASQTIKNGQKTAKYNGQKRVCSRDCAFVNGFDDLVNALRAVNC